MITITKQEEEIYQKIKIAHHLEDLYYLLEQRIQFLEDDIKTEPENKAIKENLKKHQILFAEIKNITNYHDVEKYEKYLETVYWDAEKLEIVADKLVETTSENL